MGEFRRQLILEAKSEYDIAKQDEYRTMMQYKTMPCEDHAKQYWVASNKTTMARSKIENILRENVYRRFTPEPQPVCDFWDPPTEA